MKIVQSFWSLPAVLNKVTDADGRSKGGWLSEKYHAISWALSCVKFNEFYPDTTLYTDQEGMKWLINTLHLPYKHVKEELDVLNTYNPLLWALPKIYVYGKQEEPFIHTDGDVFIWQKFAEDFVDHPLVAQNFEIGHGYYNEILEQIKKQFEYIPECLQNILQRDKKVVSINAGILGGTAVSFYKEYSTLAFEFVDRNQQFLGKINGGMFNSIFEQLLLYSFANMKGLDFETAFEDSGPSFETVVHLNTVPMMNKYIHTVGASKQNPLMCLEMEARLKYEHPQLYRHIADIYKDVKIFSLSFVTKDRKRVDLFDDLSLTRKIIKSADPNFLGNRAELENHIKKTFLSSEEPTPFEEKLSDIYHLESAYCYLKQSPQGKSTEQFFATIEEALPILYYNSEESFLNEEFSLDCNSRKILFASRRFNEAITTEVIESIYSSDEPTDLKETRLILMESYCGEVVYSYLESWDLLLYYFEDNILSGNQLIEMIEKNETPFQPVNKDLKKGVVNFLLTHAFLYRRLKPVRLADSFSKSRNTLSLQS